MNLHRQLGPRASLLLGLLGHPMTVTEIAEMIDKTLADDELMALVSVGGGAPRVALQSLSDGGEFEIEKHLERLRSINLADYVGDPEGGRLWRRLPLR